MAASATNLAIMMATITGSRMRTSLDIWWAAKGRVGACEHTGDCPITGSGMRTSLDICAGVGEQHGQVCEKAWQS